MKKKFVYKHIELTDGENCPHCGRGIVIYNRMIHKNIARSLRKMLEKQGEYYKTKELFASDLPIAKYWGLIEPKKNENKKCRDSGFWRLTWKGIEFAQNKISVPAVCYVYDDKVIETSSETVRISDCLKEYFDYNKIRSNEKKGEQPGLFDLFISKEKIAEAKK